MSEQSMRNLEKKVFLSYHDDGLLECFVGLLIVAFAAGMVFDSLYYLSSVMPALAIPLYTGIKKRWIIPRIGHVVFGKARKTRMKKEHVFFVLFFAVTALAGVILFVGFDKLTLNADSFLRRFVMLPMGIIGFVAFSAIAYWKQTPRFAGHGLLMMIFIIGGPLLNIPHPLTVFAPGGVILVSGIFAMIQFFRKYPAPAGEAEHAGL